MRKVKLFGKRFKFTDEYHSKRRAQQKKYYAKNKDKWKGYRKKKVKVEPLLITVPV